MSTDEPIVAGQTPENAKRASYELRGPRGQREWYPTKAYMDSVRAVVRVSSDSAANPPVTAQTDAGR